MAETLVAQVEPERRAAFLPWSWRARSLALGVALTGLALVGAALLATGPAIGQVSFPEPAELVSENGVLDAPLTVASETIDIGGGLIAATVYNGSFSRPRPA